MKAGIAVASQLVQQKQFRPPAELARFRDDWFEDLGLLNSRYSACKWLLLDRYRIVKLVEELLSFSWRMLNSAKTANLLLASINQSRRTQQDGRSAVHLHKAEMSCPAKGSPSEFAI